MHIILIKRLLAMPEQHFIAMGKVYIDPFRHMEYFSRYMVLLASVFFLSSCIGDYRDHYAAEKEYHTQSKIYTGSYYQIQENDFVWILPDNRHKAELISYINRAQQRIWIQIYMWTDKDVLTAILDAYDRGVDVRVILEWSVYWLPRVNAPVYTALFDHGIPVRYADNYRFVFTHAKFWIIDDRFFLSTGNMTRSFFEKNRDIVLSSLDEEYGDFLMYLFEADFSYKKIQKNKIPSGLVLSPESSRKDIERLLKGATESIILYTQTLQDASIIDILTQKNDEKVRVQVCTAHNESNQVTQSGSELEWRLVKKPYLHQKVIVVDWQKFFLWSQNLTKNSLERNREVGIIFYRDTNIATSLDKIIKKDCNF